MLGGLAAAAAVVPVLDKIAPPTAYQTYVFGKDAMYTLTIEDIRKAKRQLCSMDVKPFRRVACIIHPQVAKDLIGGVLWIADAS
jgi:hypothetical protein